MRVTVKQGAVVCSVDVREGSGTLLDVLRIAGAAIDAPCGGNGTCGKCRVLVRDETGLSWRLACDTLATEGMEVVVEPPRAMEVSVSGARSVWDADGASGEYGIAVDVGTTTVVVRVVDLASGEAVASVGRSNPQIPFGADVISRITACEAGHLEDMRALLAESLSSMIDDALARAGVERTAIARMALAGNTVMEHIAAGIDPAPIGVVPFTPPTLFGHDVAFVDHAPAAYFLPCCAGYVGGDVTAGMLASGMLDAEKPCVLLDLGTNGEMALGDKAGIVACATAAGPVFEGANIRFGMPAYPGAVSRVAYRDGELSLSVIGGGEAVGICGTGLIGAVALMLDLGVVDGSGLLLDDDEVPEELARFIGEFDGENAFFLTDGVCVTQKDVRCLQLAKSAVCAGVLTMLEHRGIDAGDVGELLIAGGFGEYLNLESAARIGLFPEQMLPVARSVGNTAIEGATAALVSDAARERLVEVVGATTYLELSTSATFNALYVETMMFSEE